MGCLGIGGIIFSVLHKSLSFFFPLIVLFFMIFLPLIPPAYVSTEKPIIELNIPNFYHSRLSSSGLNNSYCWDIWAVYSFELTLSNLDGRYHRLQQLNLSHYTVTSYGQRISQGWLTYTTAFDFPHIIPPFCFWHHSFSSSGSYFNEFFYL